MLLHSYFSLGHFEFTIPVKLGKSTLNFHNKIQKNRPDGGIRNLKSRYARSAVCSNTFKRARLFGVAARFLFLVCNFTAIIIYRPM